MSQDRDSYAPRHPSLERRSLVLWTGYRGGVDLEALDRSVSNALALPLKHAANEAGVVERAHALGMGVVLPGQAWLNQLPPADRGGAFARLPYALRTPLDPDAARLSDTSIDAYAEAFLEAQLLGRATLVTTPAHVLGTEAAAGRAQELAFAHATAAAWEQRQGWRPPPDRPDGPPRTLFATLAVRGRHVGAAAEALVDAYADLPVEGYWVVIVNGGASARQLEGITRLALGLQERTGRPVAVNGATGAHVALLASGVAATCAGLHGMRPAFPPVPIERADDTGVGIAIYHPAILGTLPLGPAYAAIRTRLFALQPCGCGHHAAGAPPTGRRAIVAHNTACLTDEARDATFMAPAIDEQRLAARVERANRLRRPLGLSDLPVGWTAVARAARAFRAGEDLADEG
ncbi:hypothetical protein C8N24_4814 [Solirubrobacter pauli]|uniref:Uncharacterized protein n=1 Tax=Solirubrobacter pauli TaxID=166793 RepID=A0A660L1J7_9ACTN|nr:hypothetical protein [Solirubrobacter pauli]RKQ86799.1 hypothetical protein C8N24_4814 [Solirubrobacter pauli]